MDLETTKRSYQGWIGRDAFDRHGDKIGEIDNLYVDVETGRPEWVAVRTGWFGSSASLAPIIGSDTRGDGLQLDVEKGVVKDAPNVDVDEGISPDAQRRLYDHYGIDLQGGPERRGSTSRSGEDHARIDVEER